MHLMMWLGSVERCLTQEASVWSDCFNINIRFPKITVARLQGYANFSMFVAIVGYCLAPLLFLVYLPLTFKMWNTGERALFPYLYTAVGLSFANAIAFFMLFSNAQPDILYWFGMYGASGFFTGLLLWLFLKNFCDAEAMQHQLENSVVIKHPEDKTP